MGCFKYIVQKVKNDFQKKMKHRRDSRSKIRRIAADLEREASDNRVPMDFSQGPGRIIDDPREIEEMEKTRPRPALIHRRDNPAGLINAGGRYRSKPYYHGNIGRAEAARLVKSVGIDDGAFLLRNSQMHANSLVLTYTYRGAVHHHYLTTMELKLADSTKATVATLDGLTKFSQVHELVEFYRLNEGSIFTKLTFPVVRGKSSKKKNVGTVTSPDASPKNKSPADSPVAGSSKDPDKSTADESPRPKSLIEHELRAWKALRLKKKSTDSGEQSRQKKICPVCGSIIEDQPEPCRVCSITETSDTGPK